MNLDGLGKISYETIYLMIYANHQEMGIYQQYLRRKHKHRRRKGQNQKRGGIPNRIGIEHRPKIAELKTEIGHWESDTVIGCNHTGIVVKHVDKASKYLLAGLNEHTNGLIREFYPKNPNFKTVKEEDFQRVVDFINHRPRKSLDYRTPYKVFFASSEPVAFHL